ncbi:retrovirus-related pol polyprotein from transposon TNT 1-94 [Tanacetum coccineum]
MGMVDNTLFTKKKSSNLIIVQIYVDDIIFGLTCQDMCDEFAKIMHDEFEMSMMGELNFFLGLQIKQMEDGIFFNQSKYIKEMLKKFGLEDSKPMKTPMSSDTKLMKDEECESVDSTKYRGMIGTTHLGLWYPKGTGIETIVYADSDHAGDYVDRKSTSGICTLEQGHAQMLKQAKILKGSFLNGLSALKSNFTQKLEQGISQCEFECAFSHIFGEDVDTFTTFSQNMDTLEQQLTKETILESNCQNAFRVLKTQFEKIFTFVLIKPSSLDGIFKDAQFKKLKHRMAKCSSNVDQLEKLLDKRRILHEIGSMASLKYWT